MAMPDRGPGPYYPGQQTPVEPTPADRRGYQEPPYEPAGRERYVQDTRVIEGGSVLQWGSVWGGLLGAIGLLVVLGIVGLIVGLNRVETGIGGLGQTGTASLIWGAVIVLVSFFVGGWIAGRTLSYPASSFAGFITGSVMWALGLTLVVLLAAMGIGGAITAIFGPFGIPNLTPGAVGTVQSAAVGTLAGLVLTYIVCVLGAMAGAGGARGVFRGYDGRVR